jgi:hypothetical protein
VNEAVDFDGNNRMLIDPDPFAVFLGVLSFIGSVTSVVSYIEFRRQRQTERSPDQLKLLHEARDLLMGIEVDTMQMEASLQ